MKQSIKMQYRKFKNASKGEEGKTSTCRFTRKDDDLKPLIVGGKMILDYVAQLENENAKLKRKNLFKAMTDEKIGEIINEKR